MEKKVIFFMKKNLIKKGEIILVNYFVLIELELLFFLIKYWYIIK